MAAPLTTERFEQLGQSWGKHAFTAASSNTCGFGCNGVGGNHLGSGCSDAYGAGLNGSQTGIGSRAWVNPFTGSFPGSTANNHSGHSHDATSHRMLVETSDLIHCPEPGRHLFCRSGIHRPARIHLVPKSSGPVQHVSTMLLTSAYTVSGGPTNLHLYRRRHHRARAASDHGLDRRDGKPAGA